MIDYSNHDFSTGYVVLDFYTDYCPPCRVMAPILEELSEKITNVTFFNALDNAELSEKFNILSVPTLVMFKNNHEIDRKIGLQSKPQLEAWITEQLN